MKAIFWDLVGYMSLSGALIGQVVVGWGYLVGQFIFLTSNICALVRCFKINQAAPDKVKNVCFTSLTIGLIIIYFIKGGI